MGFAVLHGPSGTWSSPGCCARLPPWPHALQCPFPRRFPPPLMLNSRQAQSVGLGGRRGTALSARRCRCCFAASLAEPLIPFGRVRQPRCPGHSI